MPSPSTVAVLVGSLRKASSSRKMALAAQKLAPPTIQPKIIGIGHLALYNEDAETEAPAEWTTFREAMKAAQAVLFVTPEYNRSVPGVLKNAIDVGSKPAGQSVFGGKPGAIISVSPGAMGGFGANHHLRQSLVFLDVPVLQQPEAYIGGAANLFDETGDIANPSTRDFVAKFMAAFAEWVAKLVET